MTEAEWLASTDPARMLEHLTHAPRGGRSPGPPGEFSQVEARHACASDRKLRLFAVACVRAIEDGAPCPRCEGDAAIQLRQPPDWRTVQCPDCRGTGRVGWLTDPRSRAAVEVAEKFADGVATRAQLAAAHTAAWEVGGAYEDSGYPAGPKALAGWCCVARIDHVAHRFTEGGAIQAAILRDICGNPFRRTTLCGGDHIHECEEACGVTDQDDCPDCQRILGWGGGTVAKMARTIYDERRWGDLPVLADALEEAGCADEEILRHCRGQERCWCASSPETPLTGVYICERCGKVNQIGPAENKCYECGSKYVRKARCRDKLHQGCGGTGWTPLRGPHARGCWVIDLLLGKE